MYVQKEKENKRRAIVDSIIQKTKNIRQGLGFEDNRPETVTQNKIRGIIEKEAGAFPCLQRATIVQKPTVLGMHHWELTYNGDPESQEADGQIGVISATEDREAKGSTGKLSKLLKGKAFVRVANRHLSGYQKVDSLEDNTIDQGVRKIAERLKGSSQPFNQITNNCQDFVTKIWTDAGGEPDPKQYNERNKILNEFTRSPTPEEVAQNMADMYLYM